ncbi:hypothetical protein B296_00057063, partial [Ensete ventricosum]
FVGKGKQQGELQFTGLWRLPHTAEEGDLAGRRWKVAKGASKPRAPNQGSSWCSEEPVLLLLQQGQQTQTDSAPGAWSAAPEGMSVAAEDSTVAGNRRQHYGRQHRRKQEIDRRSVRNLRLRGQSRRRRGGAATVECNRRMEGVCDTIGLNGPATDALSARCCSRHKLSDRRRLQTAISNSVLMEAIRLPDRSGGGRARE